MALDHVEIPDLDYEDLPDDEDHVPLPDFDSEELSEELPDDDYLLPVIDLDQLAPVGGILPPGYRLRDGRVERIHTNAKNEERIVEVLPVEVTITSRAVDVDTREEHLSLTWSRKGIPCTLTVSRAQVADQKSIVSLAGYGFPVNSATARGVVEFLAAYEQANLEHLPVQKLTSNLGWQSDFDSFVLGAEDLSGHGVTFRGPDEGDDQIAVAYQTCGSA